MKKLPYKNGDVVHGIKVINFYSPFDRRKCLFLCPICDTEHLTLRNNLLCGRIKSCGCIQHLKRNWKPHKYLDLSGKQFGDLHVIQRDFSKPEKVNFLCKCKCGKIKSIFSHYLTSGKSKTCGCSKNFKGSKHNSWKGCGDITGHQFAHIRNGAKNRRLKFNVTIEYLWELFQKQNQKCELTGLPISLFINKDRTRTASLDRIDNNGGYVKENVQWIHKDINYMKRILSQEQLIQYCHLISNKHPTNT
jgi:hypothetical protein